MIASDLDMAVITEAIERDLPFGVWCADFNKHIITGYNKYDELLNIDKNVLDFKEFNELIRADYREFVASNLDDIQEKNTFEMTFPTNERWIKAKMTHIDTENNKAYGYIVECFIPKGLTADDNNTISRLSVKQNQIINRLFDKIYNDQYEGITEKLLNDIRDAIGADRASVVEYNIENQTLSCTYESTRYGIEPRLDILKNISIDTIEWINGEMQKGEAMFIYDIDKLPHDKHIQIEILSSFKVKTMIILPMRFRNKVIGFIILDFLTHNYSPNQGEADWIQAMSRFVEYSINICNKEKIQLSEKERLNVIINITPFGHIHLRFVYNEKNEPQDMLILATNKVFNNSINNCDDIKGKLISEVFGKEATHILDVCCNIARNDLKEDLVADFLYFNGEKLSAGIIMPNYNDFICITTKNIQMLYATRNDGAAAIYKQQISRDAHHELRTKLNAILGFAELLSTETEENNKNKYMEIIKENAQSLLDSSFPQETDGSTKPTATPKQQNNGDSTRKKIMVAEDTESNYMLVSYILKNKYDLVWAHDGVEAIEMFEQERPDLILMDVRMPRLGGLSATSKIRESDKEIPIIALTAFAFESDRAKTIEAGCTDFMAKPIKGAVLKEMITKYLGE